MLSERGKRLVVLDGFKFRFCKKLASGKQLWRCTKNDCNSFLNVDSNDALVPNSVKIHNHLANNSSDINRQKLSNNLKRKAVDEISARPAKLLHTELRKSDVSTITTTDVTYIRNNINRTRRMQFPKIPKTFSEFHTALNNMNVVTNAEEKFMMVNDAVKNIICFTTILNLTALTKSTQIFVDGTFYSSPKPFYQLFTVHGLHENIYVPLVFFLLPDKKTDSYEHVFKYILQVCNNFNLTFNPTIIRADFELAIHTAIRRVLPSVKIAGCRFHLGQSWWKKIQELGLTSEYKRSSEIGQYLRSFFGLSFLRPDEVLECFTDDLMAIQPDDDKVRIFTDYVFDNYIENSSSFPPEVWAEFSSSVIRTTNNCEAFHSKLNCMFYVHPNMYQFLSALLDVQCDVYIKLRSTKIKRGTLVEEKEKFLRESMHLLKNSYISRFQYVQKVSVKFQPSTA